MSTNTRDRNRRLRAKPTNSLPPFYSLFLGKKEKSCVKFTSTSLETIRNNDNVNLYINLNHPIEI